MREQYNQNELRYKRLLQPDAYAVAQHHCLIRVPRPGESYRERLFYWAYVPIEDLIVALLLSEPEFLRAEAFSKIRIPLADFETLDKEERMRILLRELQRTLRSDQRHGVNGFEVILGSVELSGEVDDCV